MVVIYMYTSTTLKRKRGKDYGGWNVREHIISVSRVIGNYVNCLCK